MRSVVLKALSLAGIALIAGGHSAVAQAVIKDRAVIGLCVCEQQRLEALMSTLRDRQESYQSSQNTLNGLNRDLATRRDKMNVYDDSEVEAYRRVLEQRDAAAAVSSNATDSYNAAILRYNQAFGDYNASCAGKSFDQSVYSSAQASLSCPKP